MVSHESGCEITATCNAGFLGVELTESILEGKEKSSAVMVVVEEVVDVRDAN